MFVSTRRHSVVQGNQLQAAKAIDIKDSVSVAKHIPCTGFKGSGSIIAHKANTHSTSVDNAITFSETPQTSTQQMDLPDSSVESTTAKKMDEMGNHRCHVEITV